MALAPASSLAYRVPYRTLWVKHAIEDLHFFRMFRLIKLDRITVKSACYRMIDTLICPVS